MYTCTKCGSKDMRHYCMNCEPSLGSVQQELAELKSLMAGWYKLLHQLDLTPEEVQLLHSKDAQLQQACTLANDSKEEDK